MRPRDLDSLHLSSADESLADLQPEDSDEETEEGNNRTLLTGDQQKLEFMAALNLVPPAVMEGEKSCDLYNNIVYVLLNSFRDPEKTTAV